MQALIPRLTGRAISDAVVDRSPEKFGRTLATLALVSGVTAVASGLRGSCFLVAMAHLGLRVRHRLYRAMLQQDMAFFDDSRTGPPRPAPPAPPAPPRPVAWLPASHRKAPPLRACPGAAARASERARLAPPQSDRLRRGLYPWFLALP